MDYETAKALALAASGSPPSLAPYEGSTTDLTYLRDYVVSSVAAFYGVSEDIFDVATEGAATLVRDWLHRALYQPSDLPYRVDLDNAGETIASETNDVASLLRYPAYALCGGMAWQMLNICNALGWTANRYDVVNGELDQSGAPGAYTNSHVTVEIYLEDLHKFAIVDVTYNFRVLDENGTPLSFIEAREDQYDGSPDLVFDTFGVYHFNDAIKYSPTLWPADQAFFESQFARVPFAWQTESDGVISWGSITSIFPDWSAAHTGTGGTHDLSGASAAVVAIARLAKAGADWTEIADILRQDGRYVSGFEILDDTGSPTAEVITVRLKDGSYVSYDITHFQVYYGSYDQLVVEAAGGSFDRNAGDLSSLLGPARFMSYDGHIFGDWTDAGQTPYVEPGPDIFYFASSAVSGANVLLAHSDGDRIDLSGFAFSNFQQLMNSATYTANGLTLNLGSYHTLTLAGMTKADLSASDFIFHPVSGYIPQAGVDVRSGHQLAGDFNGDGASDLIWRDANGKIFIDDVAYGSNHSFTWQVWGTGDFNGDGKDDFVEVNNQTGAVRAWLNQDTWFSINNIDSFNRASWNPAGLGDFDGNGQTDLLLRNTTTGRLVIHEGNGNTFAGGYFGADVPYTWKIAGTGDFDGDGQDSVLWRTDAGQTFIWDFDNYQPHQTQVGGVVNGGWEVAGVGDFNGDGKDDILWWKDSTGEVSVWTVNADGTYGGGPTTLIGSTHDYIAGVGDVNGDRKDDIIWQNNSTGEMFAWEMDRRVVTHVENLHGPSHPDWILA